MFLIAHLFRIFTIKRLLYLIIRKKNDKVLSYLYALGNFFYIKKAFFARGFLKVFIDEIHIHCNWLGNIRLIFPEKTLTRRKLRPHFLARIPTGNSSRNVLQQDKHPEGESNVSTFLITLVNSRGKKGKKKKTKCASRERYATWPSRVRSCGRNRS